MDASNCECDCHKNSSKNKIHENIRLSSAFLQHGRHSRDNEVQCNNQKHQNFYHVKQDCLLILSQSL